MHVYPYSGGNFAGVYTPFPTKMRAIPTCTIWTGHGSTDPTTSRVAYFDGSWGNNNGFSVDAGATTEYGMTMGGAINSGTRLVQFNFQADAEL